MILTDPVAIATSLQPEIHAGVSGAGMVVLASFVPSAFKVAVAGSSQDAMSECFDGTVIDAELEITAAVDFWNGVRGYVI